MSSWVWVMFHPMQAARELGRQRALVEVAVHQILDHVRNEAYARGRADTFANLQPHMTTDMLSKIQEERTRGFHAGVNAARRKDERTPKAE